MDEVTLPRVPTPLWKQISPKLRVQLDRLACRRARWLGLDPEDIEGDTATLSGAFYSYDTPRSLVEYVLHEVAHLVVAGGKPSDGKDDVGAAVEAQLAPLSEHVRDQLEIDTTFVVYHVGMTLGLWGKDHEDRFIASCSKGCSVFVAPKEVPKAFARREILNDPYFDWHRMLLGWFIGKSKIFPLDRDEQRPEVPHAGQGA